MLIHEALKEAAASLDAAGVDGPGLTAELIMAHVLGLGRAGVLARLKEDLGEDDENEFNRLVALRTKRVPLQHITGTTEFFSRIFKVTQDTLIPRPETELLVQEAIARLDGLKNPLAADIGTGSGCIAVTLAAGCPGLKVYAVDPSAGALAVTVENARTHGVSDRVVTLQGSLFDPLEALGIEGGLDLIVSNPPYIPSGDIPGLQPEVIREPASALDGGPDGLDMVRDIIRDAPLYMKHGATLLIEIGADQSGSVRGLVDESAELAFERFIPDFAGIERVLVAVRK